MSEAINMRREPEPYDAKWVAALVTILLRHNSNASATLSREAPEVLVDVADPTGPNGQRSFVLEVREVT